MVSVLLVLSKLDGTFLKWMNSGNLTMMPLSWLPFIDNAVEGMSIWMLMAGSFFG